MNGSVSLRFPVILSSFPLLLIGIGSHAQVGIGTTNPDPSAKLEVASTTKGFLPPRLTTTQRDAIPSPADGLVIFNTTMGALETYSSGWKRLALAGSNSDINSLNALSGQMVIKTVSGPINTSSYAVGDVVLDQSSGNYYFFKPGMASQSSLGYEAPNMGLAFDIYGNGSARVVLRFTPNRSVLTSISIHVNIASNAVLSVYSALNACSESSNQKASVYAASKIGSSSPNSGSGILTFVFPTPLALTANTDYYMTFDEIGSVYSIGAKIGSDPLFSTSNGTCSLEYPVSPGIRLNFANYSIL